MEQPPTRPERRLHRSTENRLIFGVAGGLAEYFDVDPNLVRVGFVVLTILSWGTGILLYLLLALILPPREQPVTEPRESIRENVKDMRREVERLADRVVGYFRRLTRSGG